MKSESCQVVSTLCDPLDCSPTGSSLWDSPDKNTGVGSHSLFQGIFLTWNRTLVSRIAGGLFTIWDTRGASKPSRILPFHCLLNSPFCHDTILFRNLWWVHAASYHKAQVLSWSLRALQRCWDMPSVLCSWILALFFSHAGIFPMFPHRATSNLGLYPCWVLSLKCLLSFYSSYSFFSLKCQLKPHFLHMHWTLQPNLRRRFDTGPSSAQILHTYHQARSFLTGEQIRYFLLWWYPLQFCIRW